MAYYKLDMQMSLLERDKLTHKHSHMNINAHGCKNKWEQAHFNTGYGFSKRCKSSPLIGNMTAYTYATEEKPDSTHRTIRAGRPIRRLINNKRTNHLFQQVRLCERMSSSLLLVSIVYAGIVECWSRHKK